MSLHPHEAGRIELILVAVVAAVFFAHSDSVFDLSGTRRRPGCTLPREPCRTCSRASRGSTCTPRSPGGRFVVSPSLRKTVEPGNWFDANAASPGLLRSVGSGDESSSLVRSTIWGAQSERERTRFADPVANRIQEPGSVPAKPRGSRRFFRAGPRVAAGFSAVGCPAETSIITAAPDWQTAGDSRPPNAPPLLKPVQGVRVAVRRCSGCGVAHVEAPRSGDLVSGGRPVCLL